MGVEGGGEGGVVFWGGGEGGGEAGGVGAAPGAAKLLVTEGTMGARVLVLEMATPPSTRATTPIDKEKMNIQVTVLIPRGAERSATGPDTSTSIRLISAMMTSNNVNACSSRVQLILVNMRRTGSPWHTLPSGKATCMREQ